MWVSERVKVRMRVEVCQSTQQGNCIGGGAVTPCQGECQGEGERHGGESVRVKVRVSVRMSEMRLRYGWGEGRCVSISSARY